MIREPPNKPPPPYTPPQVISPPSPDSSPTPARPPAYSSPPTSPVLPEAQPLSPTHFSRYVLFFVNVKIRRKTEWMPGPRKMFLERLKHLNYKLYIVCFSGPLWCACLQMRLNCGTPWSNAQFLLGGAFLTSSNPWCTVVLWSGDTCCTYFCKIQFKKARLLRRNFITLHKLRCWENQINWIKWKNITL